MKRLLLLFSLLLIVSLSFAQRPGGNLIMVQELTDEVKMIKPVQSPMNMGARAGAVIFQYDFSNGIPATWNNTGNPAAANWEYRGPGTTPDVSVGSRGTYVGTRGPIQSPTRTNGFVIFDSDYYDNSGIASGNHEGMLTTPVIDLTGHPLVNLEWYQYYRQYNSLFLVLLSTDGGLTFPDTIWSNEDLGFYDHVELNAQSPNPVLATVDISDLAGGQSNVVFQWKFSSYGPRAQPATPPGYYFWMIDDITVADRPEIDLAIQERGLLELNNVGLFYGQVPLHYLDNQPNTQTGITPTVFVKNIGINNATGVTLNVTSNGTSIGSSTPLDISRDSTVALSLSSPFMPTNTGTYNLRFTVTSDSVDQIFRNDTISRVVHVTDSILALDTRVFGDWTGTTNWIAATGATQEIILANYYELQEKDTVSSVTIRLQSGSSAGGTIRVTVRDTAFSPTAMIVSPNIYFETDFYELTAQDVAAGIVTIPFMGTEVDRVLDANDYIVAAHLLAGGGTDTVRILDDITVEQPWYASTINFPNYAAPNNIPMYSNGNAFGIRLNLVNGDPFLGVNAPKTVTQKLFPNPTKGEATVTYNLIESAEVTISIKDISGKTVMQLNEGRQSAGNYNKSLDLKALPNGLYIYELKVNNESFTNKLVINK